MTGNCSGTTFFPAGPALKNVGRPPGLGEKLFPEPSPASLVSVGNTVQNGSLRNPGAEGKLPSRLWSRFMPIGHFLGLKWLPMAPVAVTKKNHEFDPSTFLATIGEGRKNLTVGKKQGIFAQGDDANAVFYIQSGKVKLTVVSKTGREATIGMLSEGNFFGEGALAGQALRMGSAATMTDCELLRIDKKAMMEALHREHAFSDLFVAYLLARNIRYEEDLVDQLFNSSEKRLARVLLLLAHFGKEGVPETVVPKISQETLADMVGTTRSRVSFFMNRFRKLGFIQYAGGIEGGLQVHSSLLNVVLHD
jgi:CRP/FNR family transcriptional regulator, cyclic AMP receptor protein